MPISLTASSTMSASTTVPYPPKKCRLCTTWGSSFLKEESQGQNQTFFESLSFEMFKTAMKSTSYNPPFLLLQNFLTAENWPAWRGKDAKGSTMAGQYPSELNLQKNLQWKAPLPEKGCSTPIVWGDSILLTSPLKGRMRCCHFLWMEKENGKPRSGPNERAGT